MRINLNSTQKVKEFVKIMTSFESNADLVSGRYVVDAKSILGIFSLDLSKPVEIDFNGSSEENEMRDRLSAFMC